MEPFCLYNHNPAGLSGITLDRPPICHFNVHMGRRVVAGDTQGAGMEMGGNQIARL
jgi:hypothetical protein